MGLDKMTLRQNYRNLWHTDLMSSVSADPSCITLMSYFQLFLHFLYLLCNPPIIFNLFCFVLQTAACRFGVFPVYLICCGNELFMVTCQGIHAVAAICLAAVNVEKVNALNFVLERRFAFVLGVQSPLRVLCCKMSSIYRPPRGFMFCLQQLACIFSIIAMVAGGDECAEASQLLSCLSDLVYCSVCACMQTQHKVEMDKRDGKLGSAPVMGVPPVQQMSRLDQPVPPPALGYPQRPLGYGY